MAAAVPAPPFFYRSFLASSAEVRAKFVNTDMTGQKQLLRQGILNLVMYSRGLPDTKLCALGASHARSGLDIRPELYELWLTALLQTIREHDRECTAQTLQTWREALGKGIAVIQSHY